MNGGWGGWLGPRSSPHNEAVIKLCASARGFLSKKVDPHKNVVIGEASDSNQIA